MEQVTEQPAATPNEAPASAEPAVDPATVLGAAGGETETAPETTGKPAAEAPAADAGEPADKPADEFKWPDDWREQLAGDDDKLLRKLKRYANPANVVRALDEAQTRLSQRQEVSLDLPDDATDEQRAEMRKKLGVPDRVEEYGIKPPTEDLSEGESFVFDKFREYMHGMNLPPKTAQKLVDFYFDTQKSHEQAISEHAYEFVNKGVAELREEYGPEFKRNMMVAKEFAQQELGDKFDAVTNLRFDNGVRLGDHPEILRLLVNAGLKTLDDDALVVAGDQFAGKDIDAEYQAALAVQTTDPMRYRSDAHQKKIMDLVAAKQRRDARNQRR